MGPKLGQLSLGWSGATNKKWYNLLHQETQRTRKLLKTTRFVKTWRVAPAEVDGHSVCQKGESRTSVLIKTTSIIVKRSQHFDPPSFWIKMVENFYHPVWRCPAKVSFQLHPISSMNSKAVCNSTAYCVRYNVWLFWIKMLVSTHVKCEAGPTRNPALIPSRIQIILGRTPWESQSRDYAIPQGGSNQGFHLIAGGTPRAEKITTIQKQHWPSLHLPGCFNPTLVPFLHTRNILMHSVLYVTPSVPHTGAYSLVQSLLHEHSFTPLFWFFTHLP